MREDALVNTFRVMQDVVAPSASLSHDPSNCPACPAGGPGSGRKRPYLRGSVSAAVQQLAEAQSTEEAGTRPQANSQSSGDHYAPQTAVSWDTRPQAKAPKVEGVAEVTRLQTELKKAEESTAQAQQMAAAEREARLKAAADAERLQLQQRRQEQAAADAEQKAAAEREFRLEAETEVARLRRALEQQQEQIRLCDRWGADATARLEHGGMAAAGQGGVDMAAAGQGGVDEQRDPRWRDQAVHRCPANVCDGRFAKCRTERHIRCDNYKCRRWCHGNAAGNFLRYLNMPAAQEREAYWKRGWNATWYCLRCWAESWDCSEDEVKERMGFNKRSRAKAAYLAR